MMLNSEVQTAFEINNDPMNGTTCGINLNAGGCFDTRNINLCSKASTFDMVSRYAKDPKEFMEGFVEAFSKVLEKGNDDLEDMV